jgi:hypothetical protein
MNYSFILSVCLHSPQCLRVSLCLLPHTHPSISNFFTTS